VLRKKARARRALAARIAGDRFAVFLPDCTLDFAQQIAEMLRRQCADLTYARGDGTVQASVSVGAAELPEESPNRLAHGPRERGDRLQGGQGPRPGSRRDLPGCRTRASCGRSTDIVVVQALHEALAADRFALFAQPILPLNGHHSEPHFEFLLRMVSENSELLPPEKIPVGRRTLPVAARHRPLGDQERARRARRALEHAARPRHALLDEHLGRLDRSEEFLEFLEGSIRDSGVPPDSLCFELTENLGGFEPRARRTGSCSGLRRLGCVFALDDFGTGLSSLVYLKSLPVLGAEDRRRLRARCRHQPAHRIHVCARSPRWPGRWAWRLVAEYVETDDLRTRMAALGVDYGQGFAIGARCRSTRFSGDLALYEAMAQQESTPV
jgi:EAL domain-containing protein (putative c-di-GMP-specific phosphodiesterase class I)